MKRDFLLFATFFVLAIILLQSILFINFFNGSSNIAKGEATGAFQICFNYPAEINMSNCPLQTNQSTSIEDNVVVCEVNMSHPLEHDVFLEEIYFSDERILFEASSNGILYFDANQSGVGEHNFTLVFYDDHEECPFSETVEYEFEILDINDPPFLITDLPSVRLAEGGSSVPFALNDYFDDVDIKSEWGKPLSYKFYVSENSNLQITIRQNSVVEFFSPEGNCKTDYVFFEAKDQGNLTTNSNIISVTPICHEETEAAPGESTPSFPSICEPEWRCKDWSRCFVNGTQYRECVDIKGCDPNNYEKNFWRECEYIEPEEPESEELLPDPDATCSDGVQNCHIMSDGTILCEEGVDCGGPCESCKRIETPGIIFDEEADSLILFMALTIVFIIALIFLYIIFRRQILSFFAKISWWLTRKKRKQFLLSAEEKQDFLKKINVLYEEIKKSDVEIFERKDKILLKMVGLSREYLSSALKINYEFNFEEIKKGINKKVINDSLQQGLLLYSESLFPKERKKVLVTRQELLNFAQETRMLILNTSKLVKTDFNFKAIDIEPKGNSFIKAQLLVHNSFLALCFSEAISAKNNYYELLKLYEEMNDEEKAKIYYELVKIYHYVKTILSWT